MSAKFGSIVDFPVQSVDPATPSSGFITIYSKNDGNVYAKDSAGTVSQLTNVASASGRVIGEIITYSAPLPSLPTGWLDCDGSILNQTTYSALATLLQGTYNRTGETYPTVCRLPDTIRRWLRGVDPTVAAGNVHGIGGNDTLETDATLRTVNHNHVQNSHFHTQNAHTHGVGSLTAQTKTMSSLSNTATTGSGGRLDASAGNVDHTHNIINSTASSGGDDLNPTTPTNKSSQTGDIPFVNFRCLIRALP